MTELVPTHEIEAIVGARRRADLHIGRAVSAERQFYILHSHQCLSSTTDLRDCRFSRALDKRGVSDIWGLYRDEPMVLAVDAGELRPVRRVSEVERTDRPAPPQAGESDSPLAQAARDLDAARATTPPRYHAAHRTFAAFHMFMEGLARRDAAPAESAYYGVPGSTNYRLDPETRSSYVYVASSWRNEALQQNVVRALRAAGLDCYDFREPEPGVSGFSWSEIDPEWQTWTAEQYREALLHPIAEEGYRRDMDAMERADTFVLVLPCGRSAHLELGWAAGAGKRTVILTNDGEEPELMAKMANHLVSSVPELLGVLGVDQ